MDGHIGQLFDAFEQQGVMDDLIVIISADHGENIGELGIYGEDTLYCQFLIRTRTYIDHPAIRITTHITFHEISFPSFTQYSAQGVIEVP